MANFQHVSSGEAISIGANEWNAMLDTAIAFRKQQGGAVRGAVEWTRDSTIIEVLNQTDTVLPRRSIIGLDGAYFNPATLPDDFMNRLVFRGRIPLNGTHNRAYAVLLDPAPAHSNIVRAYVTGLVQVKLDVKHLAHEYGVIVDGVSDHLQSSCFGHARIWWTQGDTDSSYTTGLQWAIVSLNDAGPGTMIGKAKTAISTRSGTTMGTGSVSLFSTYAGDFVEDINVLNACGDSTGEIAVGKWVAVSWDMVDAAWAGPLECP